MRKWAIVTFSLVLFSLLGYKVVAQELSQQERWLPIKDGINYTISGMALIEQKEDFLSFLIVHDNKGSEDKNRFAIINIKNRKLSEYLPLKSFDPLEIPIDLEAITVIPKQEKPTFVAATSFGRAYHFELDRNWQKISLIRSFDLPWMYHASPNFEALSIQNIQEKSIVVWADRGKEDGEPIRFFWGLFNLKTDKITQIGETRILIPFPANDNVRISDLKIDSAGVVYLTAAIDNGNDGPFQSAVYVAGAIYLEGDKISFRQSELFPLYRIDSHKVEAIELIPGTKGGIVLGSDDENRGGSIGFYPSWE